MVKKITSAGLCTVIGITFANVGVIPHQSIVYDGIFEYGVTYAIVLMVLCSRFDVLRNAGRPLVIAYVLAVLGSFSGALIASSLCYEWLGSETWKLGGTFAGAFIGGGMNFVAVANSLGLSPSLFASAAVADNLSTVPWMVAQLLLATHLAPFYRLHVKSKQVVEPSEDPRKYWTSTNLSIKDLSLLAAIPLFVLWVTSSVIAPIFPTVPEVIWLTTLTLALAQFPFVQKLQGASVLAYFALHLFFIVIGAVSQFSEVINAGPGIFLYMTIIIVIHAFVVYGCGWLLRLSLPSLTIASQAAIGGPDSALAIAMAMNWKELVTPGIIVGIFGYAVGNYVGVACAFLLRSVL